MAFENYEGMDMFLDPIKEKYQLHNRIFEQVESLIIMFHSSKLWPANFTELQNISAKILGRSLRDIVLTVENYGWPEITDYDCIKSQIFNLIYFYKPLSNAEMRSENPLFLYGLNTNWISRSHLQVELIRNDGEKFIIQGASPQFEEIIKSLQNGIQFSELNDEKGDA